MIHEVDSRQHFVDVNTRNNALIVKTSSEHIYPCNGAEAFGVFYAVPIYSCLDPDGAAINT